ncbi:MAG: LptA/OstA family protein [Deltaproteobacteria bacterium]|nr:LptA/OstA family protein [Deltaproteobacteria bacterium]
MSRLSLHLGLALLLLGLGAPARAEAPAGRALPAVRIVAETMKVKGAENRAVFTGKPGKPIQVTRGEDRLDCARLVVSYDASGAVETFVAEGSVHMVRKARHLRSERAELDNRKNLLTLTGDPVMEEGKNLVRGEVMRYDLERDEVEVQQVEARVELERVAPAEGGKRP